MQPPPRSARIVDVLLVFTVAFVAVVAAAYVYMPDFQRGLSTVVSQAAPLLGY
ncbi:MAG: hypothetical protein VX265_14370 [Myxococcota bacterium]|nr:hypothetical protein [Myxococcota bacterium]MEC8424528.1 hypothetical protein [Myxococcota bacterium]